jgi:hypothetical protein
VIHSARKTATRMHWQRKTGSIGKSGTEKSR